MRHYVQVAVNYQCHKLIVHLFYGLAVQLSWNWASNAFIANVSETRFDFMKKN